MHWETVSAAVLSGASVLFGLGYLTRQARKAFRLIDTVETVVTRELEHNHGSSMKDDMRGVAIAVGATQRRVDDLCDVVEKIAGTMARHHPEETLSARNLIDILRGLRR